MLTIEFNISDTLAPTLASLPFFISAGVAPFLGVAVDRVGKRGIFSKFFIVLTVFSHGIKCFGLPRLYHHHIHTHSRLRRLNQLQLLGWSYLSWSRLLDLCIFSLAIYSVGCCSQHPCNCIRNVHLNLITWTYYHPLLGGRIPRH